VGESTDTLSTFISLVLLAELKDQLSMNGQIPRASGCQWPHSTSGTQHQAAPRSTKWHQGPYTVFAPTNAALAALGRTTLEAARMSGRMG